MKKKLSIFIVFLLVGCYNDDVNDLLESTNGSLTHAELGFELDEPNIILNEITKGELKNSINSILLVMHGNTEIKWEFEYIENTDLISKMTSYTPHYQSCEKDVFVFSYNYLNLIDKVISTRKNFCNEYEVIKTYTYNYNGNGLLKSIFMDSDYSVEENYFGYYPNGKIKEIYNNFRNKGSSVNFIKQKFQYDSLFKNVIRIDQTSDTNYHYIYEYSYDDNINPFKDVFIATSVLMPFIGPAYLSENNAKKMTITNGRVINAFGNTTEFKFNYAASLDLLNYSYTNNEKVFYVNQ